MIEDTSSFTVNNGHAQTHRHPITGHVVVAAGPPCHVDSCAVRSALAQGVVTLVLENVRDLLEAGVPLFTVADQPLPSVIAQIAVGECLACGEPAIVSVPGTPWAADIGRLRQFGFAA